MTRAKLVAGNWKMNGSRASNKVLLEGLLEGMVGLAGVEGAVCVPFPYLGEVAGRLRGSALSWGAQNVSEHARGAFTGEVSAWMLVEFGCRYAIVGHSERRQLYGETDGKVAAKFAAALDAKLTPILCVGETLEERDTGRTEKVVARQLDEVLTTTGIEAFSGAVVAYEPVWAIGTGRTATPEMAADAHRIIRAEVARLLGTEIAAKVRILYGGSVKPDNATALLTQEEIDGALVGGASLKPDSFAAIVKY